MIATLLSTLAATALFARWFPNTLIARAYRWLVADPVREAVNFYWSIVRLVWGIAILGVVFVYLPLAFSYYSYRWVGGQLPMEPLRRVVELDWLRQTAPQN